MKVSKTWFPAYGNIRVTSYAKKKVRYGDEVLFEARLELPYSGKGASFSYKRYLARLNIFALATISERDPIIITGNKASPTKNLAYSLKNLFKRNLKNLFNEPER